MVAVDELQKLRRTAIMAVALASNMVRQVEPELTWNEMVKLDGLVTNLLDEISDIDAEVNRLSFGEKGAGVCTTYTAGQDRPAFSGEGWRN